MPARPITRSFLPASITSAVTLVPLRMISPSYSGMMRLQLVGREARAVIRLDARRGRENGEALVGELVGDQHA